MRKSWACIYDDRILLEQDTEVKLRREMDRTRVPDGCVVCAIPKPYKSVTV